MSGAAVVAFGAVSALGEGAEALGVGLPGEPARVAIARDEELAAAGLERPFVARVRGVGSEAHRAREILERALRACARELDVVRPGWRGERVGLVLGTSSGGMRDAERAFGAIARGEPVPDPEDSTYYGPMAQAARTLGIPLAPAMLVLGACASGAIAVGLATRWLARRSCDLVLAGGFDDVTVFVAAGFEALRATSASVPPRPFRVARDGMALGEGAAVIALAAVDPTSRASVLVTGFGVSSDAVHITAPDRTGAGLARAARAALRQAGHPPIDLVSPHATATPFNDPAEWRALVGAIGEARARAVPVHALKAQVGHTLGAAGALEVLACVESVAHGVLPASAGDGPIDPESPARLLDATSAGPVRAALKLSAAFGGTNAAVVVAREAPSRIAPRRPAFVHAATHTDQKPHVDDLAAALGVARHRLARADLLVLLSLAAVARLEAVAGPLRGAGVVVGTALATLETNALFSARIRERGARAAEPRVFPYTSPTVAPGECAIVFGLTGPAFSVGGGLHAGLEALAAGALLVEGGDAERVVVVAADEVGPATQALFGGIAPLRTGAVALLVSASPQGASARVGELEIVRGRPVTAEGTFGHEALLPLALGRPPALTCACPPDIFARVRLDPV